MQNVLKITNSLRVKMAKEIINKLKNRIKILWMIIGVLCILLAFSSAYNIYFIKTKTFESKAGTYYTVPEKMTLQYFPKSEKRRKRA